MGFNLGSAHGIITLDISGVNTAAQQARGAFDSLASGIGQQMQRVGQQMQSIGTSMTLLTAPLAAFGATGLRTARDFDSAMMQISARTGLVGEGLQRVETLAMDMGAATVFSSQQSADAFLQLLTAGLSVEQAIATLPNVLNAAAASGESLGLSADLVTNIMSSFGMAAEDTAGIVEAMSRAAASSPASMGEMGVALQRVGGLARGMGVSVDEAAAALAILAQNGIRGEEAATQLRSMLLNMQRDTPGVAAAWESLGTTLYDLDGNARPLNDVFAEMKAALADMTAEEQNAIIAELAGTYGLTAMNALLASDGINAMLDTMDGQASAAEVAAKRMDTFEGATTSLMGSIETLQITALRPFMNEVLKPMVEQMIGVVNAMTAWSAAHPGLTKAIVGVLGVLTLIGPVLVTVGFGLSKLGVSMPVIASVFRLALNPVRMLSMALGLLLSPVGLVIAAVAALYLAIQTNFLGIGDAARRAIQPFRVFYNNLRIGEGALTALRRGLTSAFGKDVADQVMRVGGGVRR